MDLIEEFRGVVGKLLKDDVPFAIVGALALAIHGVPRATVDIDLLILPQDLARVQKLILPLGFDLPALPMSFRESGLTVHRINKIKDEETLTLDLLLVSEPLGDIWRSRETVEAFDLQLPVISRGALIRMKAMAGRLSDLADIERLEDLDD